ncbi:LysR family transcriptional regulator [Verticiella sediminum]|uniref:LysR family transcriptional regulator n=1 Tax=Verticiella sediminum TaxID=1247510 RepID=A0A556AWR1_9BURK|nr:LysR family transcriptional regulator [Verticiella sediminum]TSH97392.1 LysR family transcriptional regulator [Verticiella sediminum]
MDLKRIEHLLIVVESGSFSRAASVIGMAQPALGRQIQALEQECGVPLLYRHGRGVALTPEGERFVEGIRPILRQVQALSGSLQKERAQPRGDVIVGMTPTMLELFGLGLVQRVRRSYPDVKLNIVSGYSGYIHEWLVDGRLDIALLHDAQRSKHIAVDFLASAGLHLVSAPSAPAPGKRRQHHIDMAQLDGIALVLPTRRHGLRRTLESAAAQARIRLRVDYEMDTLELMKDLVLTGVAHTVLALPAIHRELRHGTLTARRLRRPAVETRVMVATAFNRAYTQAMRVVQAEITLAIAAAVEESPVALDIRLASAA